MNGFHEELLNKIVGINGHVFLQAADTQFTDYDEVVKEVAAVPGVELAVPIIESPAAASTTSMAFALVRGIREADIKRLPDIAHNVKLGTLDGFDMAGGVAIGQRLAENLGLRIATRSKS
jgi:lipoprotein-releasing system permease protein